MNSKKKKRFYIIFALVALVVAASMFAMIVNSHIQESTKGRIVYDYETSVGEISRETLDRIEELEPQCIMVLGCGILDEETPSTMLKGRLDTGISLYNAGVAPKLLLTGDNGQVEHNEIHVMLNYCLNAGVPAEDIFCDHAGFSTNESMLRAAEIFDVERLVIVTQRYHEYRALYDAEHAGLEALGVAAYLGQSPGPAQEMRELMARNKDFLLFKFGTPTAVGGEKIDITGDGRISHGE